MTKQSWVWTDGRREQVPDFWEAHNWERPYGFLKGLDSGSTSMPDVPQPHPYLHDKLVSGFDVKEALARRSLMQARDEAIPFTSLNAVLRGLYMAIANVPHVFAGVVTCGVESWRDGYWLLENSPRSLSPSGVAFDQSELATIIQGQVWGHGRGITAILGIDWDVASDEFEDPNQAYASTLVSIGRIGHSVLLDGQHLGMAARMTPAVHESTAARILNLDKSQEPLYVIRLALPLQGG